MASFVIKRRAPAPVKISGVVLSQKEKHVVRVIKELHGFSEEKRAEEAAAEAIKILSRLPRFAEMNTRMMLKALEQLNKNRNRIYVEGAVDYQALADLAAEWNDNDYPRDRIPALRAMLLRYCAAILAANPQFWSSNPRFWA